MACLVLLVDTAEQMKAHFTLFLVSILVQACHSNQNIPTGPFTNCSYAFDYVKTRCSALLDATLVERRVIDYANCEGAPYCTLYPANTQDRSKGICVLKWSKVCKGKAVVNGTWQTWDEGCCPLFSPDLLSVETTPGWGRGMPMIDNSKERTFYLSALGETPTLTAPPHTFKTVNSNVFAVQSPEPFMTMPNVYALNSWQVSIYFQEFPLRPMQLALNIYPDDSPSWKQFYCVQVSPNLARVLFYYDYVQGKWLSFPQVSRSTSTSQQGTLLAITATVEPRMVYTRNTVLTVALGNVVMINQQQMQMQLQLPNQVFTPFGRDSYYEDEDDRLARRCMIPTLINGIESTTVPKGYTMIGAPTLLQWIQAPLAATSVRMQVPMSVSRNGFDEVSLSDDNFISVRPSFLNASSRRWEKLQNCSYQLFSSDVICWLEPAFFAKQGLRISFANLATDQSYSLQRLMYHNAFEESMQWSNFLAADPSLIPPENSCDSISRASKPICPTFLEAVPVRGKYADFGKCQGTAAFCSLFPMNMMTFNQGTCILKWSAKCDTQQDPPSSCECIIGSMGRNAENASNTKNDEQQVWESFYLNSNRPAIRITAPPGTRLVITPGPDPVDKKFPSTFMNDEMRHGIQFQDLPKGSLTLAHSYVHSTYALPCQGSFPSKKVRILFYYDAPLGKWLTLPGANVTSNASGSGETTITATIQPGIIRRNKLNLVVASSYALVPQDVDEKTQVLQIPNYGFQEYGKAYHTMGVLEDVIQWSQCIIPTPLLLSANGNLLLSLPGKKEAYVVLGAPLLMQWEQIPSTAYSLRMQVPPVAAEALLSSPTSSSSSSRSLLQQQQQSIDESTIQPSFLNSTSGLWEQLANCSYDAETMQTACWLEPAFFDQQGVRIMFANLASNQSSAAGALLLADREADLSVLNETQQKIAEATTTFSVIPTTTPVVINETQQKIAAEATTTFSVIPTTTPVVGDEDTTTIRMISTVVGTVAFVVIILLLIRCCCPECFGCCYGKKVYVLLRDGQQLRVKDSYTVQSKKSNGKIPTLEVPASLNEFFHPKPGGVCVV